MNATIITGKTDAQYLSRVLDRIAAGEDYCGSALLAAKKLPCVTTEDRALLGRYLTGWNTSTDHIALADLAIRIRAPFLDTTPFVGRGATELAHGQRFACTVTGVQQVRGNTILTVQADHAIIISGSAHDGTAEYSFAPNPHGDESHYRRQKDGRWQRVIISHATGLWGKAGTNGLIVGVRGHFLDQAF